MSSFIKKVEKYLVPPGHGVHTVHTASEFKESLNLSYYSVAENQKAENLWKETLKNIDVKTPMIFGVCSDTGGGIQRGANWGPLFIRNELIKMTSQKFLDVGDVKVIPHLLHDKYLNQETIDNCKKAIYGNQNVDLPVSPLSMAAHFCQNLYHENPDYKLLSLGGDHSVSYPLVMEWLKAKKIQKKKVAIIHFDAHTDLLDQRLGIDICFGSWAYHMLEHLDDPSLMIQLGIRSSGKPKEYWEKTLGVTQYWPDDFKKLSLDEICNQITAKLESLNVTELYISCDIDALDSSYAKATGTPESGGLEPHQIIAIISTLSKKFSIMSADLVEVAPFVKNDSVKSMNPEPQTTLSNSALIINSMLEAMNSCP